MRKIFYGVYLKRDDISTALDLIRFLGEPGSIRFSHVTLRGPYRSELPKSRIYEINSNPRYAWTIALTEPVAFFEGTQSTIAIGVDLLSLSELLYKPDFPGGTPHITLYDGTNRAFARELYARISQYRWRSPALGVSRLRRIERKKKVENEFLPCFMSFHALYERVVGDPRHMTTAWSFGLDRRLDLIDQIVRGAERQPEPPLMNQDVTMISRAHGVGNSI